MTRLQRNMPKGEREKQAVKVKEVEELPPEPCYQRRVGFGSDMANKPGGEFGALLPPEEEGAILTISSFLLCKRVEQQPVFPL